MPFCQFVCLLYRGAADGGDGGDGGDGRRTADGGRRGRTADGRRTTDGGRRTADGGRRDRAIKAQWGIARFAQGLQNLRTGQGAATDGGDALYGRTNLAKRGANDAELQTKTNPRTKTKPTYL